MLISIACTEREADVTAGKLWNAPKWISIQRFTVLRNMQIISLCSTRTFAHVALGAAVGTFLPSLCAHVRRVLSQLIAFLLVKRERRFSILNSYNLCISFHSRRNAHMHTRGAEMTRTFNEFMYFLLFRMKLWWENLPQLQNINSFLTGSRVNMTQLHEWCTENNLY